MYIGEIITSDIANGEGFRLSIFVSGCTNHCNGCFQPETWNFDYGERYDDNIRDFILEELSKIQYKGVTILGGDPFELQNQEEVRNLILDIKNKFKDTRDIWMYTGYLFDVDFIKDGKRYIDNITDDILDNIDILVDGRFELDKKDITLRFKGSSNQRIIDVKE